MAKQFLGGSLVLIAIILVCFSAGGAAPLPATAANGETAILVGAGDIADCKELSGAEATAKLLVQIPGTVMAVGDLA